MAELTEKSEQELLEDLAQKRKALKEFRFNLAGARVRNNREGRTLRHDIARILTELNGRGR